MISAWAAGLTEHGIQVKLFGKSEIPGQFYVRDFNLTRPTKDYTTVQAEPGDWSYGITKEWLNSLPPVILDAIQS